jgi:hypothetical protein
LTSIASVENYNFQRATFRHPVALVPTEYNEDNNAFPCIVEKKLLKYLLETVEICDFYCHYSTMNLNSTPITLLGMAIFLILLQQSNVTLGIFTVLFLVYPQSAF